MLPLYAFGSARTLTSVRELSDAIDANTAYGVPFDVEGEVLHPRVYRGNVFYLRDRTGTVLVCDQYNPHCATEVRAGYRVRVVGATSLSYGHVCAAYTNLTVVARGDPPPPDHRGLSPTDLTSGRYDQTLSTLVGKVLDVFPDEIDPSYFFLAFEDGTNTVYVTTHLYGRSPAEFDTLIGCTVEAEGVICPKSGGTRLHIGRTFSTQDITSFRVLAKATETVFDAPPLEPLRNLQPADILALGRRRIVGETLAVWNGNRALIQIDDRNAPIVAELVEPLTPRIGETVEVVGFPVTDLYRVILRRAHWRTSSSRMPSECPTMRTTMRDMFVDRHGRSRINSEIFGTLVTVSGVIIGLPSVGNGDRRMYLQGDGFILPVDIGSCPHAAETLVPGCTVEVTGVCVTETDNWQPGSSVLPSIKDVFLVARRDGDIRVTARPPWWTPGRLMAVISGLLALLLAVLLWNTSLRRLAERRGRALFRTEIDKAGAELKTYERTRLAIELHDMLSQMLSGISMQIGTVRKFFGSNAEKALRHLDLADKTLLSCRENLRDCLWDLRNSALEEPDMDKAIRETLEPHVEDTALAIRFNIPRDRLTDNTAHAILSIIRELTVNALRHGNATSIRIAGCIDGENVLFSVSDNGCGFDPGKAPGMAQGHFGLQGIQERVEGFEGDMDISGGVGQGVKVSIRLNLPTEKPRDTEHA